MPQVPAGGNRGAGRFDRPVGEDAGRSGVGGVGEGDVPGGPRLDGGADAGQPAGPTEVQAPEAWLLSPQQRRIVVMVGQGITLGHTARTLGVSYYTVKEHLTRVRDKYGLDWETPRHTALRLYWGHIRS